MSRARNIKPGFFTNEELAEIDPIGRLLFIGLWTLADREGRLEDRVKRIKASLFPYDNCDIDSLLNDLQEHGFIVRYHVNDIKCIQILKFSKHQKPHPNEKKSELPAYASIENHEKVIQTREMVLNQDGENAVASTENPASSLNPYSLNDESLSSESVDSSQDAKKAAPKIPYDEIIEHYHRYCPSLSYVKSLTDKRRSLIKARFVSLGRDIDKLDEFLKKVEQSDFLTGRNGKRNGSFGIDWIFKESNFVKIQEGNYDNRTPQPSEPEKMGGEYVNWI